MQATLASGATRFKPLIAFGDLESGARNCGGVLSLGQTIGEAIAGGITEQSSALGDPLDREEPIPYGEPSSDFLPAQPSADASAGALSNDSGGETPSAGAPGGLHWDAQQNGWVDTGGQVYDWSDATGWTNRNTGIETVIVTPEGTVVDPNGTLALLGAVSSVPSVVPRPNPARSNVDWAFIAQEEGGLRTSGYIPAANKLTGVTIGAGVDLGSVSVDDLKTWGASQALIDQLSPYLGLQGADARALLNDPNDLSSGLQAPLNISNSDALLLTAGAGQRTIIDLATAYDDATGGDFAALPAPEQTAVADVAFQTGQNGLENHFADGPLLTRTPKPGRRSSANTMAPAVGAGSAVTERLVSLICLTIVSREGRDAAFTHVAQRYLRVRKYQQLQRLRCCYENV